MKTNRLLKLALLLLLGFAAPAFAGGLEIEWAKCYGGRDSDTGDSIFQTSDGGYIIGATTMSKGGEFQGNHGSRDFWIFKIDARGKTLWQRMLGGSGFDGANPMFVRPAKDGGCIMAGQTDSSDGDVSGSREPDNYDVWIVKLDEKGGIKWEKTYGGPGMDFVNGIDQTKDGGYIVVINPGWPWYEDSTDSFADGSFIVKLDESGNIVWRKKIEKAFSNSVEQTRDCGYIAAGHTDINPDSGEYDCWAAKLNPEGEIEWQKSFGGSRGEDISAIRQTIDGGYIAVGYSNSIDGDVSGVHEFSEEILEEIKTMTEEEIRGCVFFPSDFWIVKLNASGDIAWQRALGGSEDEDANFVVLDSDGGFIVGGTANSSDGDVIGHHGGNNSADFWIVKLDSSGNLLWQRTLGGSRADFLWGEMSVAKTNDGGYIAAGSTRSRDGDVSGNNGDTDVWIVKLSPEAK